VSRAPLEKLLAYRERLGWSFPWVSSGGSDFNYDFTASFTAEQLRETGGEYNFRPFPNMAPVLDSDSGPVAETAASCDTTPADFLQEAPGMSAFAIADGVVQHTYSAYARGLDGLWGAYQWLDRAPLGRGDSQTGGVWTRKDEYDSE
jgi:predicted dithiol-disulfide oxidoreductase (DUF899 family)